MNDMFGNCRSLTSLDLSNFNTGNVTYIDGMFGNCNSLETLNISNFDMSKVESANVMFDNCDNLRELRLDNCSAETVSKIINATEFPTGDVWGEKRIMYVNSKATDVLKPIDGWVFIDCETEEEIEVKEPGEEPAPPYEKGQFTGNGDITVANTLVTKEHDSLNAMFSGCTNLAVVDTSDWNTSNVYDMNSMFYNCENLPYLDLSSFDTGNIYDMVDMFYGCTDLLYLDISNFTVEEGCATGKYGESGMFWDCASLLDLRLDNCYPDTIERIINSNGFQVNPNNVIEDLPRVVYVREENKHDLTLSDGSVFGYIKDPVYITDKDFDKWEYIDGKEVVNVIVDTQIDFDRYENNSLERLFENCRDLRLINGIEEWNTTGINNMVGMFAGCSNLVSLNLSSFDISNAHGINNMFDGCENLRYLDISNFIMGEEAIYYNTTDMFRDCNNLRHLRLDNCDRYTIEKIINDNSLPTGDISGEKRKMYVKEANIANEWCEDRLNAPDGWEFVYLVEAKKEEE
jgi:surface protein